MNASRAIFWSFVHVLSASGTTLAFPIPPQTLWDLTLEAERVVVARVETVKIDESGDLAVLRVIETWKGPFTEFIRVRFSSRMICPAPPRYVEGREVLAFLKASDEVADSFTTVGLSYGSLYPAVEDRQAFWQLVHRLGSADDSTSFTMKKEWHVEAASRRATRWHGLYGLESSADAVHSFYDRPQEGSQHLGALLSADEISAIAEGFLNEPSADVTLPMVLVLLRDFRSAELDTTAVALVEGTLRRTPPPYWTAQTMILVWERFGDPRGQIRLKAFAKPDGDPLLDSMFWTTDAGKLEAAWIASKGELPIPDVQPLVLPDENEWGVGFLTPP